MKKQKKNLGGRPSKGLTEAAVLVRAPASLVQEAARDAEQNKLTVAQWWRNAALNYLTKEEK